VSLKRLSAQYRIDFSFQIHLCGFSLEDVDAGEAGLLLGAETSGALESEALGHCGGNGGACCARKLEKLNPK